MANDTTDISLERGWRGGHIGVEIWEADGDGERGYYKSAKVFHTTNGAESAAAYLGKLTGKRNFFVPENTPQ